MLKSNKFASGVIGQIHHLWSEPNFVKELRNPQVLRLLSSPHLRRFGNVVLIEIAKKKYKNYVFRMARNILLIKFYVWEVLEPALLSKSAPKLHLMKLEVDSIHVDKVELKLDFST